MIPIESFSSAPKESGFSESQIPKLNSLSKKLFERDRLKQLALGTKFDLGSDRDFFAPDTTSFKEQYQLLETSLTSKQKENTLAIFFDSISQSASNKNGNSMGDKYILGNMESVLQWGEQNNYTIIIGRYSGDEMLALAIPIGDEYISTDAGKASLEQSNHDYFYHDDTPRHEWVNIHRNINTDAKEKTYIGATFKIKKLCDIPRPKDTKFERERSLLSQIIDGVEDKVSLSRSKNIVKTVFSTLSKKREINEESIELLKDLLPHNIQELVKSSLAEDTHKIGYIYALAEYATFESSFKRRTVYKIDHLSPILSSRKKPVSLMGRAANILLKDLNSKSHSLGDDGFELLILRLREIMPGATFFKDRGSIIFLDDPENHIGIKRNLESNPSFYNQVKNNHLLLSMTYDIWDEDNQRLSPIHLSPNTTQQEITNNIFLLKKEQQANEIKAFYASTSYASIEEVIRFLRYLITRSSRLTLFYEMFNYPSFLKLDNLR